MISDAKEDQIRDILTHHPFDCEFVCFYEREPLRPIRPDETAERVLNRYEDCIRQVAAPGPTDRMGWAGDIGAEQENNLATGRYYGACLIEPEMVVVVAKPMPSTGWEPGARPPIDGYFLNSLHQRITTLLGLPHQDADLSSQGTTTSSSTEVRNDLQALKENEKKWRDAYGSEEWLAVKNGTVVDHDPDREALEDRIYRKGKEQPEKFGPPVLYVPPEGQKIETDILQTTCFPQQGRRQ